VFVLDVNAVAMCWSYWLPNCYTTFISSHQTFLKPRANTVCFNLSPGISGICVMCNRPQLPKPMIKVKRQHTHTDTYYLITAWCLDRQLLPKVRKLLIWAVLWIDLWLY